MTVAATSRTAYHALDLAQSEAMLLALVQQHFPFPKSFTRKELGAATGWEINRITGRVNGLVEKGYLKEYTTTRDGGYLLSIAPTKAAVGQAPSPGKPGDGAASSSCGSLPAPAASTARKDQPAGCYWPRCECPGGGGRPCELKSAIEPHQVGDRYYDRGDIVEVTRAPKLTTWHGAKLNTECMTETVRVVARVKR